MAKKLSKLSAPLGIEREYQKKLRKITTKVKSIINEEVVNSLPFLVSEADILRPKADSGERFDDDVAQKIKDLFTATGQTIESEITDYELYQLTEATATEINNWNKAQVGAVFKQGLGVEFFGSEQWLSQELNSFVEENVKLIKSNNAAFLSQTESVVFDGIRRGLRHEEIAKDINGFGKNELGKVSRFKQSKTRANLIARDQVNKLNGQLTKLRQESIGVKRYIWRNVGDNRVRDDHQAWGGKEFTWKKGSPNGTHPGEEIQCRCYAEPILDDLLNN